MISVITKSDNNMCEKIKRGIVEEGVEEIKERTKSHPPHRETTGN